MAGGEGLTSTGERVNPMGRVAFGCSKRSHARPDDCCVNARQQTTSGASFKLCTVTATYLMSS